jgi:Kef-type K+ transport system membrane component KefB
MQLGEDLITLGVLLVVAYVLGRLGKLIGLPSIPIYMVVGLLASPNTGWFPLNFHAADIELIAVFGLILLLFSLGLEFDQEEFFDNAGKLLISGGSYVLINLGHAGSPCHRRHDRDILECHHHEAPDRTPAPGEQGNADDSRRDRRR